MRLPSHIKIASNGIYYFRLAVPSKLRPLLKKTEVVRSLGTRDPRTAKLLAYGLSAHYLAEFKDGEQHAMKNPSFEDLLRSAQQHGRRYELQLPNGVSLKAEGEADHFRALEALKAAAQLGAIQAQQQQVEAKTSVEQPITLNEAGKKWLLHIKDTTKPKTLVIKAAALKDLEAFTGNRPLHSIGKTELADFCQFLQNKGIARPTIVNKFSYLKGFFTSMMAKGHYPKGDNPAVNQIAYSKRDKRVRARLGSEAFTTDDLKKIFAAEKFLKLKQPSEYWAPLLGLFTGARVNELCQLMVEDVKQIDGISCISISEEDEEQSTKNKASIRLVPLHPILLDLGFVSYVQEMKRLGNKQVFPNLQRGLNGFGDAESKAFIRHVERVEVTAKRGRKSFHSFRSTVIQKLQDVEQHVSPELRCQYVGHELQDEHFKRYSRKYTPAELAKVIHPNLTWDVDLKALKVSPDHFNRQLARKKKRKTAVKSL